MNDITRPTGFLAYFKRNIEPRMDEFADTMAARHGKKRVKINVEVDSSDDWEFVSISEGGKTWISPF